MGNHWPIFHDDAVSALRAVLKAWGPLCESERQLAEALTLAVKVQWDEIAPPERQAAQAAEGDGDRET